MRKGKKKLATTHRLAKNSALGRLKIIDFGTPASQSRHSRGWKNSLAKCLVAGVAEARIESGGGKETALVLASKDGDVIGQRWTKYGAIIWLAASCSRIGVENACQSRSEAGAYLSGAATRLLIQSALSAVSGRTGLSAAIATFHWVTHPVCGSNAQTTSL